MTPFCDGTQFDGVHFFPDDDVFCQWDVEASGQVRCVDGQTGGDVDPPAAARLRARAQEEPRLANYTALLHVRQPQLVDKIPNLEREQSLKLKERRVSRSLGRRGGF